MNFASKLTIALLTGAIASTSAMALAVESDKDAPRPDRPRHERNLAPLTKEQAKEVFEGRLISKRSDLLVQSVTDKDDKSFEVKLAKADGSDAKVMVVDKIRLMPLDQDGKRRHMGRHHHMDHHHHMGPHFMDGPHGKNRDHGPEMVRKNPLTAEQVKDIVKGKIAFEGHGEKLGKIEQKDGKFVVEIIKADGKTRQLEADPLTGHFKPLKKS